MTDTDNFYCNNGTHLFIRLNGIYYCRRVGKPFDRIAEDDLPTYLNWSILTDKQRAAYEPFLPT